MSRNKQFEKDIHSFIETLLITAGGEPVVNVVEELPKRKRADIIFQSEDVIAEIKTVTNDRLSDPDVFETLNELIAVKGPAMGGPIVFGTCSIDLDKLPDRLARRAFRLLAKTLQRQVASANRQFRETKEDGNREDAHCLLVVGLPPMKFDLEIVRWAVADAIRGGENSHIDSLMVVECESPDDVTRNLFVSHYTIRGKTLSNVMKESIRDGLRVTIRGPLLETDEEALLRRANRRKQIY